jgi:hypothetical protein
MSLGLLPRILRTASFGLALLHAALMAPYAMMMTYEGGDGGR